MDLVYLDDYGCSNKVSETFATLVAASDLVVFAKNWGDGAGDRNTTEATEVYSCYEYMRRSSPG